MKKNIAIIGWNSGLNDEVAMALAGRLEMYYLSLAELTCYHACRPSKQIILKEGGFELYNKFYRRAVIDAIDFDSTVISASVVEIKPEWLIQLKEYACIVFLNETRNELLQSGIDLSNIDVSYSRQRFQKYYDIFIKTESNSTTQLIETIFAEIENLYGGSNG